MAFDWLKSLRSKTSRRCSRLAFDSRLGHLASLEHRMLLAATPIGPEFLVNSHTSNIQIQSAIGMDADGDFVVTWESFSQDGHRYGIYAQRYSAAGVKQGVEFQVNSHTLNSQFNPAIGMDADGDFVITWVSEYQDGSNLGIYAQRFSAAGIPQGTEFRVNSFTTNDQFDPAIGMDADGDFVITWTSYNQTDESDGIYARRFNASGVAQGGEFLVNTFTTNSQYLSAVEMDADGDFVITWASYTQDYDGDGIYAQRYNAAGVAQGVEFQVNSHTTGEQRDPEIGMDAGGDFVITWRSSGQDGDGYGIYAQRYNAAGVPQGGEFLVNSHTTSDQQNPAISMDADGDFVVAWESYYQDDGTASGFHAWGVYAQQYNSAGVPQGGEFRVNTRTTDYQIHPAIGMDSVGDFVVSWSSYNQDGSAEGIYAQRYSASQLDAIGVKRGSSFYLDSNHSQTWNGSTTDTFASFGNDSDKPVIGDWNGDGYDDIGIWRSGVFYLDANGNGIWDGPATDQQFPFGNPTDTPLVGDWNGDGTDEIGVWRAGRFYLDLNANRVWNVGVDLTFVFGNPTDTPLVGDWNGDGTDDIGIWRAGYFYRDTNGNRAWNSGIDSVLSFGNVTDTPLIGDWNADGTDDIGIWRAGEFYQDSNGNGVWNPGTDTVANFGNSTDTPLVGYWRSNTVASNPPSSPLIDVSTSSANGIVSPARSSFPVDGLASLLSTPVKKLTF